jgi:hypothetical protein
MVLLIAILAVVGFQVGADEIRLPLTVPPAGFAAGAAGGTAQFPGMSLVGEPGQPGLPVQRLRVILPPHADLDSVSARLDAEDVEELPGAWDVNPVPPVATSADGRPVWPSGRKIANGRDVAAYAADKSQPAALVGRVHAGRLREWRMVEVECFLYRYNPAAKRLSRLRSAQVVISFRRLAQVQSIPVQPPRLAERVRGRVREGTVNFSEMEALYAPPVATEGDPAPQLPRYVIITRSTIQSGSTQLANFVALKQAQGFTVSVVTEGTWGGGTGNTAAENIRAWLAANYLSMGIEYVLLIGNPNPSSGDVPMKMCYPQRYDTSYLECPTDYYYAELTGDWDLDNDGLYGEYREDYGTGGADRNCEVVVGRIPYYGTMSALDSILSKLVTYQLADPTSIGWRKKALFPMEPSDSSTPGYQLGEEIKNAILVPKGGWAYHRVYESTYSLTPPPETTPCNVANVTAAWLASYIGATFWWTHGSETYAADVMNLTSAATLDNTHPSFVFQCSCLNAHPETVNNLSYSLLKNGAISAISGTRVTWYWVGQTSFNDRSSNSSMTREYAERLIGSDMFNGDALQDITYDIAPEHEVMWMNYLDFNVYGDPAMGLLSAGGATPSVTVAATDATAGEPLTGQGTGVFTFSRTGSTTAALTVNFTVGGTATSGSDYTALGTTVSFAAGSATTTKTVSVLDDVLVENSETVLLTLASGTGYTVGSPATATVTVRDDESTVVVAATDATAGEPLTGQGGGTFTFTRSGFTGAVLTVNFTVGGTAASGSDYTALGTTVSFAAGSATTTKTVSVLDDVLVENSETVLLTLASGTGYTVGSPATATVTVRDDESTVVVAATDATAGEPLTGQGGGTFTFTRSGFTGAVLTVNFTVGGTAASGSDYTALGTTVGFAAGAATATKTVSVLNDTLVESDETVVLTLASGTGYTVGSPSAATVTIRDDDSLVSGVIVDNTNAANVTVVGAWTTSTYAPGYWAANYLHDGAAGKGTKSVTFRPNLPSNGFYAVYLWWPAQGASYAWASNTPVDISSGTATNTVVVNQKLNGNAWFLLGTNTLTAGTNGWLRIRTDGTSGYVVADAARFVWVGAPPVVPVLAVAPLGLTNSCLAGTTAASQTFQVWNAGSGTLSYGIGDNVAWLSCSPTSGTSTGEHDVVNVNYASAGLATGTYSGAIVVTGAGATQTVAVLLTVTNTPVPPVAEVIVDNTNTPNVTLVGAWTTSTWAPGYWAANYLHDGNAGKGTKSATFRPNLPVGGTYEVSMWWPAQTSYAWASNAPVDILSSSGTNTLLVNQKTNGSRWVVLGTNTFAAGTNGWVRIRTGNTTGTYVIADAVRFAPLGAPPVVPVLAVAPLGLTNSCLAGTTAASQTFQVWNAGSGTLSYGIGDNVAWLSCSPTSGTSTGEHDVVNVNYASAGLATGTYSGAIVVTGAGATQTVAVLLTVTNTPVPPVAEVIVDNTNTPNVTLVGAWTTSTWAPGYWAANYLHDGNAGKGTKSATFRPNLPVGGTYEVSMWWPAQTSYAWASNAPVDILSSSGTNTLLVNQKTNGSRWVVLGTYTFAAGTNGWVRIRTGNTTGTYVIADAVRFAPVGAPPVVPVLAVAPLGLTNSCLAGTTAASQTFQVWNAGSGTLSYGIGDNVAWLSCSPTSGTSTGEHDVVNVNYATAGLATGTYSGAITVSGAGGTQTVTVVLAVTNAPVPPAVEVIVDNTNTPNVTVAGAWTTSTWAPGYYRANYLHDGNADKGTKSVTFRPNLPSSGSYEVYLWWPAQQATYPWASAAPVDIKDSAGTNTVFVNQKLGGGQWTLVAVNTFAAGTNGWVRVRTTGTDGYVIADAVRFVKVASLGSALGRVDEAQGYWPVVYTGGGQAEDVEARVLVDGDTNTIWTGLGESPWRIMLDLGCAMDVSDLGLLYADEPWLNEGIVGGTDLDHWFDLGTVTNWPVSVRYIYLNLWDHTGTNAPALREIVWRGK